MKLAAIPVFAIALVGCSAAKDQKGATASETDRPIEWIVGMKPLSEYQRDHPNRKLFAFFTMEGYDLVGMLLERQLDQNRNALCREHDFLFLKFDCTDLESLGMQELERLNLNYIPVFIVGDSDSLKPTSNANAYNDLERGFIAEVNTLIE